MRLIEKFKEQLKIDYNLETTQYIGTNISLNDDFKNTVIKDIISIEFSSLYPVLLVLLHEENIFKSNQSLIDRVKNYILNKKELDYEQRKIEKDWVNSLYIKELRLFQTTLFDLYRQYMNMVYNELITKNNNIWLYLDTDVIYFRGLPIVNIQGRSLDAYLPYSMKKYDLGAFLAKKRYVLCNEMEGIKYRGFSQKQIDGLVAHSDLNNIQALIKDELRDLKLNYLINGLS